MRSENYRRKAAELRDLAEKTTSSKIKEQFMQIAQQYDELAAVVRALERADAELQRNR